MIYECHITCSEGDAMLCEAVARELHWKTSEIARDPMLGQATYCYMTSHDVDLLRMYARMTTAVQRLGSVGVGVIRTKIELIVHDSRGAT